MSHNHAVHALLPHALSLPGSWVQFTLPRLPETLRVIRWPEELLESMLNACMEAVQIGPGLLCLVGLKTTDTAKDAAYITKKILKTRPPHPHTLTAVRHKRHTAVGRPQIGVHVFGCVRQVARFHFAWSEHQSWGPGTLGTVRWLGGTIMVTALWVADQTAPACPP
ncbi:hypothetical protein HaLaN_25445 [Haematococcus lacustris]|uniref:Uncharacterized protein n=1 Tax=Haematococcus lacustris TaxID=44745 RepID=A0A6A0A2L3_HAELA|nr:hypothetical protein HaLaN_25445 [Haematococcus lacustris]